MAARVSGVRVEVRFDFPRSGVKREPLAVAVADNVKLPVVDAGRNAGRRARRDRHQKVVAAIRARNVNRCAAGAFQAT